MKRLFKALAAAVAGASFLAACGGGGGASFDAPTAATTDLATTARSVTSAQTITRALDSAGMTQVMASAPALTLLAPTDEALAPFAAELAELRQPENREALEDFVKAHVLDQTVLAEALQAAASDGSAGPQAAGERAQALSGSSARSIVVRNLHGEELTITLEGGQIFINGAQVSVSDIKATNGVLHQLRAPLYQTSVFSVIKNRPDTTILEAAVRAAGLEATLRASGSFTLFAPTDAAFAALLSELGLTAEQLLANKPLLTTVLTYHVLATRERARDIDDGETLVSVQGQALTAAVSGSSRNPTISLTDARGRVSKVTNADLRARNGVVHLIDKVVLPTDRNIVQLAQATPSFSVLVEAVAAAGLVDTLTGDGPFTVFAPTDAAFGALLSELGLSKAQLLANKPLLSAVLTYHVIAGERVLAEDLREGGQEQTVNGQKLGFRLSGGPRIVDARGRVVNITATNVQASNGVIHVIDRVLLPLIPETRDLVTIAQSQPQFSLLVEAVTAAGLVDALKAPGPLTVFAPTNDAFVALLGELGVTKDALFANRPLLTSVLTYHVLPRKVVAADLRDHLNLTTLQGQKIRIDVTDGPRIRDARGRVSNIVATDVAAGNGVIHAIDRVILPRSEPPVASAPATVVQLAQSLPQFSVLVEAVTAAGLGDALSARGPFTVFAPTNEAFAALLGELGISKASLLNNKPLLTSVLTYHVLQGRVLAGDLRDELARATLNGQPLVIDLDGGPKIRDGRGRVANIVATDVLAGNGVVHAIDRVILPSARNIVQVAQSRPEFSILVEAVIAAGLVDPLTSGKLTVFAPTNDAFAALLTELGLTKAQLLADKLLLTKVLTYHVVHGQVLSSDIPFGQAIRSLQGESFTIRATPLQITDARGRVSGIVATDVAATNGVIHAINRVILPR